MEHSGASVRGTRNRGTSSSGGLGQLSPEHYLRVIFHRKWWVLAVFVVVSSATFVMSSLMPNVFSAETLIMVDPQKVPDIYVKSTVSGDVRNRLGTLSQQILSATRLQKIIDTLNLYPEERKSLPREDVIALMRHDIGVQVVSDFGASQDMQAFRIRYSGKEPRLVAQVTNELASLFIEENLKAREQQATGTTEFLQNQLQETRKTLELHEAKLKDFKLRHIGEMPEQQAASLQLLGQLQSQLQLESQSLNRAEQQKAYLMSMLTSQSNAPAVDVDDMEPRTSKAPQAQASKSNLGAAKARLAALLDRYSAEHPEVKRVKRQIQDEEAKEAAAGSTVASTSPEPTAAPAKRARTVPAKYSNPVLESQLRSLESEIAKHQEEQHRLSKQVAQYRSRLEAIPVREQEMSDLVRDYEISKAHYKSLLEKQLSAETATQLEIRQKGERFTVLDPAQPAERPSSPNRPLINFGGCVAGLALGLMLALVSEFMGISITSADQITAATGLAVLEVIPVIRTHADRMARRRKLVFVFASSFVIGLFGCAVLLYHYRDRVF